MSRDQVAAKTRDLLVPMMGAQAGDDAAAVQVQQRPRQLPTVIRLLVAKVVGAEQLAGRVVQPVGGGDRDKRVGSTFHNGVRGLTAPLAVTTECG